MPLYEFKCECGNGEDRFLPYSRFDEPQSCGCGRVMERVICTSTLGVAGSTLVYTPEGKGALAREMAVNTLNDREGGQPALGQRRKEFQQKAFAGI